MVHTNYPQNLTEEEELLLKKYAKLRKRKKALQAMRAPKSEQKQEPSESKKRPAEAAADATEQAKKLLKSGAIKVEIDRKDHTTFKRTKRLKDPADKSSVAFQPFSPTHSTDQEEEFKPSFEPPPRPRVKNLRESFVSSRERFDREPREREPIPKTGNTVYVSGQGVTEDVLSSAFSGLGRIINISVERERSVGFVTFEKEEAAAQAISEINGSLVSGIMLRVSMARRQPSFENHMSSPPPPFPPGASTGQDLWRPISENNSQKATGSFKDTRDLVTYNEDDDMF